MSRKITKLDIKGKETEERNESRFKDINKKIMNEIRVNNEEMEDKIFKNVIETLKPKITAMHDHIVQTDLIRIVKEQLEIQKRDDDDKTEEEESEKEVDEEHDVQPEP